MAATALPGDEANDEDPGIVAEINVTPLTDIFLVLLIIFMVTTTAAYEEGKNIDLPSATESAQTPPEGVTVEVGADGVIRVNDLVVPYAGLEAALGRAVAQAEDKVVVLKGDKKVLLGEAVDVLDMAQRVGAEGIAIATQQPAQ